MCVHEESVWCEGCCIYSLSSCVELRPHQPKNEHLIAECGRIRDMASVS